jgi:hypothetical protein
MADDRANDVEAAVRQRTRRAVLVTSAACGLLAVNGAGLYVAFKVKGDEVSRARTAAARAEESRRGTLAELSTEKLRAMDLRQQVERLTREKSDSYLSGFTAASKISPISEYDPGWYIFRLVKRNDVNVVDSSFQFTECLLTYREQGAVYTRPNDRPC